MSCENNTKLEQDINYYFKFPIYYNDKKVILKENIIKDLELISTIDTSPVDTSSVDTSPVDTSSNPISSYYFNTQYNNEFAKNISRQISHYYTTDIDFLKENQILLKEYQKVDEKYIHVDKNYSNIIEIWKEIKEDSGFKEKYQYVDWSMFEFLNHSECFLQIMSFHTAARVPELDNGLEIFCDYFLKFPVLLYPTYMQIDFKITLLLSASPVINFRLTNRFRFVHEENFPPIGEIEHDIFFHGKRSHYFGILYKNTDFSEYFKEKNKFILLLKPYFDYDEKDASLYVEMESNEQTLVITKTQQENTIIMSDNQQKVCYCLLLLIIMVTGYYY